MGEGYGLDEGAGAHGVVEGAPGVRPGTGDELEEGSPGGGPGPARLAPHGRVGVAPRVPEPVAGAELDPAPPRVDVVGAQDARHLVGPVAAVPPSTEKTPSCRVAEHARQRAR